MAMISIRKSYFYLFTLAIVSTITAPLLIPITDELTLAAFATLALTDMIFNRNFRRYKLMFALIGVMTFYLAYSLLTSAYSIPKAMLWDYIIQCKPLIAFSVSYAIAPTFTPKEKSFLKCVCLVLAMIAFMIVASDIYEDVIAHIYHSGLICAGCAMVYLLLSVDSENPDILSKKDLRTVVFILLLGLVCTRSKYYGFFVLCLYMLFIYKPGTVNLKSIRNIAVALSLVALIVLVAWQKIEYYFITGNSDSFDPDVMETYARPVLYATSFFVFADHLLLGSGLASFATYFSGSDIFYSTLYHEYGISMLWGLSPTYDDFIADTFYPELAQFGLIGVFFFVFFCRWIWRKFRITLRTQGYRLFSVGVMCIAFLAIDATAGCSVLNASGELLMVVMGIVASAGSGIPKRQVKDLLKQPANHILENNKTEKYEYKF